MSDAQTQEEKIWEKPWNPQELVNNSTNWSLAGDAGVLNFQFKLFIILSYLFLRTAFASFKTIL